MRNYINCFAVFMVIFGFSEASYAALTDGLVAYYPFSGNAYDESGNGNNGTVTGTTVLTTDRHGTTDKAYAFDASVGGINISNTGNIRFGSGDLTISAWFESDSATSTYRIIYTKYEGNPWSMLAINPDGKAEFLLRDNNGNLVTLTSSSLMEDGIWHHAVGIRDGSSMYLYVDGLLDDEVNNINVGSIDGSCAYSRIGGSKTVSGHCSSTVISEFLFDGKIDQLRLYNRALSVCEVQELFIQEIHN